MHQARQNDGRYYISKANSHERCESRPGDAGVLQALGYRSLIFSAEVALPPLDISRGKIIDESFYVSNCWVGTVSGVLCRPNCKSRFSDLTKEEASVMSLAS